MGSDPFLLIGPRHQGSRCPQPSSPAQEQAPRLRAQLPFRHTTSLEPMPDKTKEEIFTEITDHITKNGGVSVGLAWYAGITSVPRRRLFEEHGVSKKSGKWIWRKAGNVRDARNIEQSLLRWGCAGGSGGGGDLSLLVYPYESPDPPMKMRDSEMLTH